MGVSRRKFLNRTLGVAPLLAIAQASCRHSVEQVSMNTNLSDSPFESAYLKAEREGRLADLESRLWEILQSCRLARASAA